jgi:hypothetical protein
MKGEENLQDDFGFDIRDGRAMVSLGPLSPKRFCTYACAFCYVHAGFTKYSSLSVNEILSYLKQNEGAFDIVYVSGDTDSLAPPRTGKGLELIEALATLGTDVLFTTRAVLRDKELDRLATICQALKSQGKLLFGCISIPRLRSAPHIEPKPVPSPEERLAVLRGLHKRGIVSVLAMRPFLPVIPIDEYIELARLAAPFVDAILGEVWYADKHGLLEQQVLGPGESNRLGFVEHQMDFDDNNTDWKIWEGTDIRDAVAAFCAEIGVPFFMRSRPAVLHIREALAAKE